jgi:uncharacterized protein RhaS with RHS repeats
VNQLKKIAACLAKGAIAAMLVHGVASAQGVPPVNDQCKPYSTTVSSGGFGTWGYSPDEVCAKLADTGSPTKAWWAGGPVNGGRDFTTATPVGVTPTGPGSWYCKVKFVTVNVQTGELNEAESGTRDMEAALGPSCTPPCPPGFNWDTARGGCYRHKDVYQGEPQACPKKKNPIYPLTGVKVQDVDLGASVGGHALTLTYDSSTRLVGAPDTANWRVPAMYALGQTWRTSLHKSITVQSTNGLPGTANSSVLLQRSSGIASAGGSGSDDCQGGGAADVVRYVGLAGRPYAVTFSGLIGTLIDTKAMTVETYNEVGGAATVHSARGGVLTYTYSDANTPPAVAPMPGLLIAVTDAFGRSIQFTYETLSNIDPMRVDSGPRVRRIIYNGETLVEIDNSGSEGRLRRLMWPDGPERTFLYEHALYWPMTGIVDENERRFATYGYDGAGRAISTEHAGGVGLALVSYESPPAWSVSETVSGNTICRVHSLTAPTGTSVMTELGQINELGAASVQGKVALTSQSQPAGSGCAATVSGQDHDANGNVARRDDFNAGRSCYQHDLTRNVELVRVEGLPAGSSCSVVGNGSSLPAGSRKLSTQWHPDWELQAKIAAPGRITTHVYNGQPDPFNSNAVASCAPATAVLPGGKPIAVLCKRVEQATTDASGAQGFSAALQAGVANRVTTWTYNQHGQVLTESGPRTDVSNITTYAYYSDTVFASSGPDVPGHTIGDLKSITNALGKITQFTQYNKHGQLLQSIDGNGVVTSHVYDTKMRRLMSTTVAGNTANYSYDRVGQLKRITQPDASYVGFDYDDAHRQVAVYDHKGNRIEYTLDKAGNKTAQKVKDPAGVLKRQMTQSIDALGRVQQTTGRE